MLAFEISDFWTKVIMYVIVAHVLVGFIWVLLKLNPKKNNKNKK